MGYVHDTQMSRFISAFECEYTAGTWTPTIATNVASMVRTAADASFTILIPITLPSNAAAMKGAYLKSIDIFWKVATAAMDAVAEGTLDKLTLPASGTAVTGAAVTVTPDTGHDSAAERLTLASHTMKMTITTPAWIDDGDAYVLSLVCDAAATSVFTFYGVRANYTLRV
jgi:hypothetical protein